MSKFNSNKVIDILGLLTAIIGVVTQFLDSINKKKEERKEENYETPEKN